MNQDVISLRTGSSELNRVLYEGVLTRHGEKWLALPREVVSNSEGAEAVVFEIIQNHNLQKPHFLRVLIQSVRLDALAMTFSAGIAAFAYGVFQGWDVAWIQGGMAFLGALFFHISVNLLNDVEDYLKLLDRPGVARGTGVIQKGWVSAKNLRREGILFLVLGSLMGVPAVFHAPGILLGVAALGALGVIGFSGKPFHFKYRPAGHVAVFFLAGPLLFLGFLGADFAKFNLGGILLGFFFGSLALANYHVTQLFHLPTETREDAESFVRRFGFHRARHFLLFLYCLAFLFLSSGWILGYYPGKVLLWPALIVPSLGWFVSRIYRLSGPASAHLSFVRRNAPRVHFWLGFAVFAGIAFAS